MTTSADLWRVDEPAAPATATLILAHGAGAPMDSPFMTEVAGLLASRGLRVVRFEFPYMQRRRTEGVRQPPNRQPVLLDHWRAVYAEVTQRFADPVLIGGKSMGGRMATLVADELGCAGVVCLGYPACPPGKPQSRRIAALETARTATLILQGERDPFGRRDELSGHPWSPQVTWCWLPDGDHDLKPRKASGRSHADNLVAAADEVAQWWQRLSGIGRERP